MKDDKRKGETVKPFNPEQAWDLLIRLVGPEWVSNQYRGTIPEDEVKAGKTLLEKLGGLALAIQQAATLVASPKVGRRTIKELLQVFDEHYKSLPPRKTSDRSPLIQALDTLWSIAFGALNPDARSLLSVLAHLSPDRILVDLFLPKKQDALRGILSFCRQDTDVSVTALSNVLTPNSALESAIEELLTASLINRDGRDLSIHRVVQEAMTYHDDQDLEDSFNAAVQLVHQAFPAQIEGAPLYNQWSTCEEYIQHGIHLTKRYLRFRLSRRATGKRFEVVDEFITMAADNGW